MWIRCVYEIDNFMYKVLFLSRAMGKLMNAIK